MTYQGHTAEEQQSRGFELRQFGSKFWDSPTLLCCGVRVRVKTVEGNDNGWDWARKYGLWEWSLAICTGTANGFYPQIRSGKKESSWISPEQLDSQSCFSELEKGKNGREGSFGDTLKYPQSIYTVGKEVKGNAEMLKVTEVGKWDVILQVEQCLYFVHLSP